MKQAGLMYESDRLRICLGGIKGPDDCWGVDLYHASPPCVSFPKIPVLVEKEGMQPFIGGVNRASMFNQHQHYRVKSVGPTTSSSLRLYFDPGVIADTFEGDHAWTGNGAQPFTTGSTIIGHQIYLMHRALQSSLGADADPVRIEEIAVGILDRVRARLGTDPTQRAANPATRRAHADAVRAAEQVMSMRYSERLTLATIARSACVAPTHLCRIYRASTGITIYEYLTRQRLRSGVELLLSTQLGTSDIAARCGFSSRSHFSDALYQGVGLRPSAVRSRPNDIRTMLDARR